MSHDTETPGETGAGGGLGRRLVFFLPVIVFLILVAYFIWGLNPERDPRSVPAGLVGKPMPEFDLPAVPGLDMPGLTSAAIAETDGPVLVNVFASWCGPCRVEHPVWMRVAEKGLVPIYGINYKDAPPDARNWLARHGNPYSRVGRVSQERAEVGIDLGIHGVPETYLIGPDGIIRYKHDGPVTADVLKEEFLPRLKKWRRESGAS